MKNTYKIVSLLAVVLIFICSCKEDKLLTYDSSTNVYFRYKKWGPNSNSSLYITTLTYDGVEYSASSESAVTEVRDLIEFSFIFHPGINEKITFIPVTIVGNVASFDRKFGYEIETDETSEEAAVEGEDFEILDAFIPAGKIHGGIVIKLYRRGVANEGVFKNIDLKLVENENFTVMYDSISRSATNKEKVSTLTMRMRFSSSLSEPPKWSRVSIGYFSSKKAMCYMEALQMTTDQLYEWTYDASTGIVYAQIFRSWLATQAAAGSPVRETNGGLMSGESSSKMPAPDPEYAEE